MKKIVRNILISLMTMSLVMIPVSITLASCSSTSSSNSTIEPNATPENKNPTKVLETTNKPSSLLSDSIVVVYDDKGTIIESTVSNTSNLMTIDVGTTTSSSLKIKLPSALGGLLVSAGTNFSLGAKLKYESENLNINDNTITIENITNGIKYDLICYISEEGKVSQTFNFSIVVNKNVNQSTAQISKFKMGGKLKSGLITNGYRELLDDVNLFTKDIDYVNLTNLNIRKIMNLYPKYKTLALTIKNWDQSQNILVLELTGTYFNEPINDTICISGFYNNNNLLNHSWKILSNINVDKNEYLFDVQTINDVNNWTQEQYEKYIKSLIIYDENNDPYQLNINEVSDFKIVTSIDGDKVIVDKITLKSNEYTYDSTTDKWIINKGSDIEINVKYLASKYLIVLPTKTEILEYMVENFLEVDYSQISNMLPSRLAWEINENSFTLPIHFNQKSKVYSQKYFDFMYDDKFIFTSQSYDEFSYINDLNGKYKLNFLVKPLNDEKVFVSGVVVLEMQDIISKYNIQTSEAYHNSGSISGNAKNIVISNIKSSSLLQEIKSMTNNQSISIPSSSIDFVSALFQKSDIVDVNLLNYNILYKKGVDLNLFGSFLSNSISIHNNSKTGEQLIFFDFQNKENSFVIQYMQLSNFTQTITKDNVGWKLVLTFDNQISIYGSENGISVKSELVLKILDSEL